METLFQDLRYGLRSLIRAPGFAAAAILTLALGIAATTTVFSLVNMMMLRPIPAHEPERLFMINDQNEGSRMSMNGFTAMPPSRLDSYEGVLGDLVTGLAGFRDAEMALRTESGAEIISILAVTPDYFELLGVGPQAGRVLTSDADATGEPTVVLSYAAWQERYAGDPGIVGRQIHLDGHPHTVVGVVREGFRGTHLGARTDAWVPVEAFRRLHPPRDYEGGEIYIVGFGRLAPGVEETTLQAALSAAAPNIPHPNPEVTIPASEIETMSLMNRESRGAALPFVAMFFVTALLVLLIAATNVTGMLLARATGRSREVAIRVAVGADRGRVVRQLVTEGVLIFLLASIAAFVLTYWATGAIPALLPEGGDAALFNELRPDARVLLFGLGLAFLSGLAFTIVPALQVSRTDLVAALKEGTSGSGSRRMRLRTTFVVTQIAMSFVLLIVAGLFVRTIRESLEGDLGFEPEGVVTAAINPATQGYDLVAGRALAERMLERVQAMPDVESAALVMFPPMSGFVMNVGITPGERAGDPEGDFISDVSVIGPGYLGTIGIPLLAGRDFTRADVEGSQPVVIVNQALADTLWPGQNPIGKRLMLEEVPLEVVGVAATAKYRDMRDENRTIFYQPYTQSEPERYTVLARTTGDPTILISAIRTTLAELDPDLALQQPRPLKDAIASTLTPQRLAAGMVGSFGLIGLLLSAIGLYGVLAYHVGQRTREIGIRIALGARARAVLGMVMRQGFALAAIGIGAGLVVAVAATRFMRALLVGVSATDALTFGVVSLLLATVAVLASWLPARRATRVDPTVALRSE